MDRIAVDAGVEPQIRQDGLAVRGGNFDATECERAPGAQETIALLGRHLAGADQFRCLTAAKIEDHPCRDFSPP